MDLLTRFCLAKNASMEATILFSQDFLIRLLINTVVMIVMIRLIYFTTYQKADHFFPFYLLNFIVFLLTFMLTKSKAMSGLTNAFGTVGLLAAFTLLRFRTDTLSTKDMTYLFLVIAIGLINAVMIGTNLEMASINLMIIVAVFIVDSNRVLKIQKTKTIEFDSLEHIKPEQKEKLIGVLKEKTGLDIRKVHIDEIDFRRSRIVVKVYYYD